MNDKCVNCGYDEALHRWDTMQCPKGGEAPINKKQEWLNTVYQEKIIASCKNCSVITERDSLKEQLQKSQHENKVFMYGLVEMEKLVASAAFMIDQEKEKTRKAETDKAVAVKHIKEAYSSICTQCEAFSCEHKDHFELYPYEDKAKNFNKACKIIKCVLLSLEFLTGQKFKEMKG